MIQDVFGLPVNLAAPFDFSFLGRYGRPFCVFDGQTSGNIAFGMQSEAYGKLLVKFAGAETINSHYAPEEAVLALKKAAPLYDSLRHPALISLAGQGEVAGGYALIFRWAEGENLYDRAAKQRLRHQPQIVKLQMLDRVFDFHLHCAKLGFMSVDFYDGNLLADFNTGKISICDIDLYRPLPAVNDRGRMPGSARFLSPEEYELGEALDSITMQYTMGALAFDFLSRDGSRYPDQWTADPLLYEIAQRATNPDRAQRYPGMGAFLAAWREGIRQATVY